MIATLASINAFRLRLSPHADQPTEPEGDEDYGATLSDAAPAPRPPQVQPPVSRKDPPEEYEVTQVDASTRLRPERGAASKGANSDGGSAFGSAFGSGFGDSEKLTVVHELGRGGMGVVQLALDQRLRRHVAIKRITGELADSETAVDRFLAEARSAAALRHANVVSIYDFGEDAEGPYILMQFVEGPRPATEGQDWPDAVGLNPPLDLQRLVELDGPLPLLDALELAKKLCAAAAHAHKLKPKVIHRDIKPANVLFDKSGEPLLVDFGLARRDSDADDEADRAAAHVTQVGARLLTLGYGAPEQEVDASSVDERADLYAIGATLYFALTGQSPRHYRESDLPEAVRHVVAKAMERDREKRHASADELLRDLERARQRAAMSGGGIGSASAAGVVETGVCYTCGHLDVSAQSDGRKYCEACGADLLVACPKCEGNNYIWARFCGSCREDLHEHARQTTERFEALKTQLPELLEEWSIDEAKARINEVRGTTDPRYAGHREWAAQQHKVAIKQREQDARSLVLQHIAAAETAAESHNFVGAVAELDDLPEALRRRLEEPTIALLGGDAVRSNRRRFAESAQRVDELARSIRSHISREEYPPLNRLCIELHAMQPSHPAIAEGEAVDRKIRAEVVKLLAAAEATGEYEEQLDLSTRLLRLHPDHARGRAIRQDAAERKERAEALAQSIADRISADHYRKVLTTIPHLRQLRADHPAIAPAEEFANRRLRETEEELFLRGINSNQPKHSREYLHEFGNTDVSNSYRVTYMRDHYRGTLRRSLLQARRTDAELSTEYLLERTTDQRERDERRARTLLLTAVGLKAFMVGGLVGATTFTLFGGGWTAAAGASIGLTVGAIEANRATSATGTPSSEKPKSDTGCLATAVAFLLLAILVLVLAALAFGSAIAGMFIGGPIATALALLIVATSTRASVEGTYAPVSGSRAFGRFLWWTGRDGMIGGPTFAGGRRSEACSNPSAAPDDTADLKPPPVPNRGSSDSASSGRINTTTTSNYRAADVNDRVTTQSWNDVFH